MLTSIGLGLVVGLILALTGAGAGILAVPLLVFGTGASVSEAGPIGLMAARQVDSRWLAVLFALVLLYVALKTFRQASGKGSVATPANGVCKRDGGSGRFIWTRPCALAMSLSGALAGLLSGLLGVGGGFVMVPALQRYTDLPMKSAMATSLAVIALISLMGVATTAASGHLDWAIALPFSAAALAGMLGGRLFALRLAGPQLQKGFASVSAMVAIAMIVKALS